jgi:hypothetical protein
MEVRITKDVRKHHTNQDFRCVVVKFTENDAFFPERLDWLPRFDDLQKIIETFVKCDKKYKEELRKMIKSILIDNENNQNNNRLDNFIQ